MADLNPELLKRPEGEESAPLEHTALLEEVTKLAEDFRAVIEARSPALCYSYAFDFRTTPSGHSVQLVATFEEID